MAFSAFEFERRVEESRSSVAKRSEIDRLLANAIWGPTPVLSTRNRFQIVDHSMLEAWHVACS
jgi:hypothetical protein